MLWHCIYWIFPSLSLSLNSQAHSYQGDFLEIALQNLTQIPDVTLCVHQMVVSSPIKISCILHNLP